MQVKNRQSTKSDMADSPEKTQKERLNNTEKQINGEDRWKPLRNIVPVRTIEGVPLIMESF